VRVYGGFAGTETMRSQRNPTTNVTILSGDIGTVGVATDNSYHVVTSDSTVTATGILDGFTVTSGQADGASDPTDRGGGAYVNLGSPSFVGVIFSGNSAGNRGGGVRVAAGSPSFTNCTFQGNSASAAGAGLSAASVGSMQVRGCVFRGNTVGNPLFVGAPADLRLGSCSPAIDSGNNAAVPGGVTTDIAGLPRFFDDPAAPNVGAGTPPIVDMGAYERVPLTVSAPSPA